MSNSSVALDATLGAYRSQINSALERFLSLHTTDDCPSTLADALAYAVDAPGKRLRPILVLLACEACGGDVEKAIPAACGIELVHTYSLIHDDLPSMDDDDLRRGRPTCHIQFGEANAILAGDALLTMAFEIVARHTLPAEVAVACCVDLAAAAGANGMVAGQVVDLEAESIEVPQSEQLAHLESIHHRKTGRLLSAALSMGARVAQAEDTLRERLNAYGKCVGLAFQIADDLLDVDGDVSRTGKHACQDAERGKLTYPTLLGVDASRQLARELIEQACENLSGLGENAQRLETLARFVIERDH